MLPERSGDLFWIHAVQERQVKIEPDLEAFAMLTDGLALIAVARGPTAFWEGFSSLGLGAQFQFDLCYQFLSHPGFNQGSRFVSCPDRRTTCRGSGGS